MIKKMGNKSSSYEIKQIGQEYNDEMLEIINENPIESGGLTLCFDRKPNIFKLAEIKYKPAKYIGFLRENKLLGFGLVGFHKAYVNGKPTTVFHLTDLYVRKSARYRGFFYKASELFFKEAFDNFSWGYSIILHGNKNAESHVSRQHKNYPLIPHSKIIGTFDAKNIIITFKKKESKIYSVRKATSNDSDMIVSLLKEEYSTRLFGPYIDKKVFVENLSKRPDFNIENYYIAEKDGKTVGVCAAWDCLSFKQTIVLKYSRQFNITKKIYSILSWLFNFPSLPPKGEPFKDIYITDCAVNNRDPLIFRALLLKIYNEYRRLKYNTIIFGSYESDELFKALKGFFNQAVKSHIVASAYDISLLNQVGQETSKPYIDIALL